MALGVCSVLQTVRTCCSSVDVWSIVVSVQNAEIGAMDKARAPLNLAKNIPTLVCQRCSGVALVNARAQDEAW